MHNGVITIMIEGGWILKETSNDKIVFEISGIEIDNVSINTFIRSNFYNLYYCDYNLSNIKKTIILQPINDREIIL